MARLILEENGERRAFKLREGKLTIGSSTECSLTLASEDVAEIHAELELRSGVATLIPRPGVTPPKVLGRPVTSPTRLPKSAEFRIGSAVFRMQPEEGAAPATASAAAGARRAPAASAKRPAAAPAASGGGERRPRIQHKRRTVERGIPTWMVLGILGVIGLVAFFVGKQWLEDRAPEHDPRSRYLAAIDAYNESALIKSLNELDKIDYAIADPELKIKADDLREKVEERQAQSEVSAWNTHGTKYMDTQLKGYERNYLKGGDISRAQARLFVKRCDHFRETWPEHPEMGWVDRYRARWADLAELSDPATVDDVAWEVKRLTAGMPRDYERVFRVLRSLQGRAEGADLVAVEAMIETQQAERQEYFTDRMQQSRWHWEREEYGPAVEWLVQLITKIGDESMRDRATDALLKMTNQEGIPLTEIYLGGYQSNRPWQFEELMEVPRIKAAARDAELL